MSDLNKANILLWFKQNFSLIEGNGSETEKQDEQKPSTNICGQNGQTSRIIESQNTTDVSDSGTSE